MCEPSNLLYYNFPICHRTPCHFSCSISSGKALGSCLTDLITSSYKTLTINANAKLLTFR